MVEKRLVNEIETIVANKNRTDTEEIIEFVLQLNPDEKKIFLSFVRGAGFVKGIIQNSIVQ